MKRKRQTKSFSLYVGPCEEICVWSIQAYEELFNMS